jgi:DNA mismatch endonuclease, patch repair protein
MNPLNRSEIMRRVRRSNTAPELRVRRTLHNLGFRFRLHVKTLPGTPDIVLPKHRLCIFVHGCFWHRHPNCRLASTPTSNRLFWLDKFQRNTVRDTSIAQRLHDLGWRVEIVWECETKRAEVLRHRIGEIFERLIYEPERPEMGSDAFPDDLSEPNGNGIPD